MGVRLGTVVSTAFIGPLPATNAETIVLTTPALNLAIDNAQVILIWRAAVLAGTSTTSFVWRLRRGTAVTSTLVMANPDTDVVAAGATQSGSGCYVDSPGVVAGVQYTLTLVQTAATGAGTWQDGCLLAMVL